MQPHNTVGVMFKRRLRIHTADGFVYCRSRACTNCHWHSG